MKRAVILVAVLVAIAYANSLWVPLVFDDFLVIQRNENVRFGGGLTPDLFGGRGLLYATYAWNYALHGQDVLGYHIVNVVLHTLNGLLVMWLGLLLFRTVAVEARARLYALLAAAVFVCHPVQTQAVTYVSGRSELLSTTVYLTAVLVFAVWGARWWLPVPLLALMWAGLLAKETVITLPAILLLYDHAIHSKGQWRTTLRHWVFYLPFGLLGAAAVWRFSERLAGAIGGGLAGHLTPWQYLLTQAKVVPHYLQLVVLPIGQNIDHHVPRTTLGDWRVWAGAALIATLLVALWRYSRGVALLGGLWFFVTLAPTSTVVPILDTMFEHRLYLPMVGASLLAGWLLGRCRYVVAVCVVLVLVTATVQRNYVWGSTTRLWADAVAKSPNKARPYTALGMEYMRKGLYEDALHTAEAGLKQTGQVNLFVDMIGSLALQLGQYQRAVDLFTQVVDSEVKAGVPDPAFLGTQFNNLGTAYLHQYKLLQANEHNTSLDQQTVQHQKLRVLEQAAYAFRSSVEYPSTMRFSALDSWVNTVGWAGWQDQLLAVYVGRDDYESRYILGKAAFNNGDYSTAIQFFNQAVAAHPYPSSIEPLFWFNVAIAYTQTGQTADATEAYTKALYRNPVFTEARYNLGALYLGLGNGAKAVEQFEEVLRYYPTNKRTLDVYEQAKELLD